MDINQLNVAVLLDRLDTYGSENFKIDKDEEFNDEWKRADRIQRRIL